MSRRLATLKSLVESVFLLKKQTKFGPYPYYDEKGRRYLQIHSQIQDNLRPYFGIQDHLRLEKQDTEADAWS
jgi:hypothetical protein